MLENWTSRKMKDYKQHLPFNCGGVATVFALYGPNQVVPEEMIGNVLIKQKLTAKTIERFVNEGPRPEIRAKAYLEGSKIKVGKETRPLGFLHQFSSSEIVAEALKEILTTHQARCLILSCYTKRGLHWQTYYLPLGGTKYTWYNAFENWAPAVDKTPSGSPTGLVLVAGPRI
jgi:hypothetical protein